MLWLPDLSVKKLSDLSYVNDISMCPVIPVANPLGRVKFWSPKTFLVVISGLTTDYWHLVVRDQNTPRVPTMYISSKVPTKESWLKCQSAEAMELSSINQIKESLQHLFLSFPPCTPWQVLNVPWLAFIQNLNVSSIYLINIAILSCLCY